MWHITPESHYHSFKQAPFCAADASPSARFAAPRGRVRLRLPPGSAGFAQSARTALRVARHTTRHSDESMTFVGLSPSPPRRPSLPICSRPGRFGAMPPFAQAGTDLLRRLASTSDDVEALAYARRRVRQPGPGVPPRPSSASTVRAAEEQRPQTAGCRRFGGVRSDRGTAARTPRPRQTSGVDLTRSDVVSANNTAPTMFS